MAQTIRRARKPALVSPPVLKLVARPPAPDPRCQAVADGVNIFRQEALQGCYVGALIAFIRPNGDLHWDAFGTLGNKDATTATVSSSLTNAVYRAYSQKEF